MEDIEQEFAPDSIFLPIVFTLGNEQGNSIFEKITNCHGEKIIVDQYPLQKKELFKIREIKKQIDPNDVDRIYSQWAEGRNLNEEGCWVFYPWLQRLIHILSREEFIELRTNRNQYKITPEEQKYLSEKIIGIIGLSVGHAVALTIASERICGSLRLADYDILELSNLNRIKTGIHNIGLNKCIVTAREIAEIDPFINIECYTDGLNKYNIDEFILENGKLDILIDECDDLEIKIECRHHAKLHSIPVVMETSDKGMLDVERFDLDNNRAILHGLAADFPMDKLHTLTNQQKVPLILKIVDVKNASPRGKASMIEVGQTIGTWPQLASAVTLGGGIVTDVCRRILLKSFSESGRFYIDPEQLVANKPINHLLKQSSNPYQPFDWFNAKEISKRFIKNIKKTGIEKTLTDEEIISIVSSGCQAPSTGNDQPWKWVYFKHHLFLFQDKYRSFSFGNFDNNAANISFGAAFANIELQCFEIGFGCELELYPEKDNDDLIAIIELKPQKHSLHKILEPELVKQIYTRCTNRNPSQPAEIPEKDYYALKETVEQTDGLEVHFITDKIKLKELGRIIGECDRIRIFNFEGHKDLVEREMKWTKEDAAKSRDGIDITTLGLLPAQLAAMSLIRDPEVVEILSSIKGGNALIDGAINTVSGSSAIGIITAKTYDRKSFFYGGAGMERLWLKAEQLEYAIYPLISPLYLFTRLIHGEGAGLNMEEINLLKNLRKEFVELFPVDEEMAEVFMFKIGKANKPTTLSYRLPLEETLFILNDEK